MTTDDRSRRRPTSPSYRWRSWPPTGRRGAARRPCCPGRTATSLRVCGWVHRYVAYVMGRPLGYAMPRCLISCSTHLASILIPQTKKTHRNGPFQKKLVTKQSESASGEIFYSINVALNSVLQLTAIVIVTFKEILCGLLKKTSVVKNR